MIEIAEEWARHPGLHACIKWLYYARQHASPCAVSHTKVSAPRSLGFFIPCSSASKAWTSSEVFLASARHHSVYSFDRLLPSSGAGASPPFNFFFDCGRVLFGSRVAK